MEREARRKFPVVDRISGFSGQAWGKDLEEVGGVEARWHIKNKIKQEAVCAQHYFVDRTVANVVASNKSISDFLASIFGEEDGVTLETWIYRYVEYKQQQHMLNTKTLELCKEYSNLVSCFPHNLAADLHDTTNTRMLTVGTVTKNILQKYIFKTSRVASFLYRYGVVLQRLASPAEFPATYRAVTFLSTMYKSFEYLLDYTLGIPYIELQYAKDTESRLYTLGVEAFWDSYKLPTWQIQFLQEYTPEE